MGIGTTTTQLDSIKVMEWGNFNKQQKYWPAKIQIKFTGESPFFSGKQHLEDITDLKFKKDDYGKWKAIEQREE